MLLFWRASADTDCRIDDRKSANPRMRGFLHGTRLIAQEQGIRGFFKGFLPTTARQAANSAVRFSSYTSLKQLAQSYVAPGEKLGAVSTFGLGGLAGIITVYTTMPIDTVKTRMQSIEARAAYKNSLDCAVKIFKNEGVLTFWSGALPRLGRLIMSGGIVFTMYVLWYISQGSIANYITGMRSRWNSWTSSTPRVATSRRATYRRRSNWHVSTYQGNNIPRVKLFSTCNKTGSSLTQHYLPRLQLTV